MGQDQFPEPSGNSLYGRLFAFPGIQLPVSGVETEHRALGGYASQSLGFISEAVRRAESVRARVSILPPGSPGLKRAKAEWEQELPTLERWQKRRTLARLREFFGLIRGYPSSGCRMSESEEVSRRLAALLDPNERLAKIEQEESPVNNQIFEAMAGLKALGIVVGSPSTKMKSIVTVEMLRESAQTGIETMTGFLREARVARYEKRRGQAFSAFPLHEMAAAMLRAADAFQLNPDLKALAPGYQRV